MDENARRVDDDALLQRLARVLADVQPAPTRLRDTAPELLTWATVDAELAELLRGLGPETPLQALPKPAARRGRRVRTSAP